MYKLDLIVLDELERISIPFLFLRMHRLRSLNDTSNSSNGAERRRQTRSEKARANRRCFLLVTSWNKPIFLMEILCF